MKTILQVIKEQKTHYLVVVICYVVVGGLELIGVSSIMPAVAMYLGEGTSHLPGMVQKYLGHMQPNELIGLYVVALCLQIVFALIGDLSFIDKMGKWRTHFIVDYVKKITSSKFSEFKNLRSGETEVVITRNIGYSVKARQMIAIFLSDIVLVSIYVAIAIYLSGVVLVLFGVVGAIYFSINRLLVVRKMRNFAMAKEYYYQTAMVTSEHMRDFRNLLLSPVDVFLGKVSHRAHLAAEKQKINDFINVTLKVIQTPLLMLMLVATIYVTKRADMLENSVLLVTLYIFYKTAPRIIAVFRTYSDILETLETDIKKDEKVWDERVRESSNFTSSSLGSGTIFDLRDARVSFGDIQVLRGVNLKVESGEFVGLVGPSGSGKSTLLDVLCGFVRLQDGAYFLSRVDTRSKDLTSWCRTHVSIVRPESTLVTGTLCENIAYLHKEVDQVRVEGLVEKVGLAHLLDQEGNFLVEKAGANLSAGQRQRVILARALYKKPDVLILDEPTSNLDEETEETIFRLLKEIKGSLTVVVTAHRPQLLALCDRVFSVDKGLLEDRSENYQELFL